MREKAERGKERLRLKLSAAKETTQRLNKQAAGSRGPKPLIQAPLRRRSLTYDGGMKVRSCRR